MKIIIVAAVAAQILLAAGNAHAGLAVMPEPGTLTLLGIGAGVVAVGAWWRNRK